MRIKKPDKKNAQSIIESVKSELEFTLTLPINEASASTIARNLYEIYRKLGDAMLVAEGIESSDHIEPINRLINLDIDTKRPLALIDNFRRTRHNINYQGYQPSIEEVEDMLDFTNKCFNTIYSKTKKIINSIK